MRRLLIFFYAHASVCLNWYLIITLFNPIAIYINLFNIITIYRWQYVTTLKNFFYFFFAEIEATEACKWLRAAGFPQYAQMYEGKCCR